MEKTKNRVLNGLRSRKFNLNFKINPIHIFVPLSKYEINYNQNEKKLVCLELGHVSSKNSKNSESFDTDELLYNFTVDSFAIKVFYLFYNLKVL